MTAETSNARGDAEYEYEVWQGDALQAGGSTPDYASAKSEASHYAMMYAPGGPVEVRIYEKRMLNAAPQPADAEPKTLPVPTRVYLTDKAAVIVGDPQRGWDEEGPEAHNCDAMGCATIGPPVLARVPFTDERALSQQPEAQGVVDEGSRSVTRQLLHWNGIPVCVTGTVTTSPGNWSLIDAALAAQQHGGAE